AWGHNPVPKPFGQSRHRKSGAGRVNRTLVGEVQALCTATVLDQQTLGEPMRAPDQRERLARAPQCNVAEPSYKRSWHAGSNCGRALTVRLLFPLSYTSGAGAAIRTPITDLRGPGSSY